MTVLNSISKWIATQLDKLKVKNPIIFVFTQGGLGILLGLFLNDTINIPTPEILLKFLPYIGANDLDSVVIVVVGAIMAAIGPRTTLLKGGSETDPSDK